LYISCALYEAAMNVCCRRLHSVCMVSWHGLCLSALHCQHLAVSMVFSSPLHGTNLFFLALWTAMDVMEFESESECCRIPTIFCKSEIRWIYGLIQIQLSFWKAQIIHSAHSAVSHTKVNKCTLWLNSYLLTSIQTKHWIGPKLLVRYEV